MAERSTVGARPAEPGTATEDAAIRPFHVSVPDGQLTELRRRIAATNWPEKETVADQSQGQFMTELDGLDIHFIHVRSQHEDALPLAAWLLDHNDADGQPAAAVVSALDRTSSATGELTVTRSSTTSPSTG